MEASIVEAPSSTKNATRERDPETHQMKKAASGFSGLRRTSAWRADGSGAQPGDDAGARAPGADRDRIYTDHGLTGRNRARPGGLHDLSE